MLEPDSVPPAHPGGGFEDYELPGSDVPAALSC